MSLIHSKALSELKLKTIRAFKDHTHALERCEKFATEASEKLCNANNRDGYVRLTLLSRSQMPMFDNKTQYKFLHVVENLSNNRKANI